MISPITEFTSACGGQNNEIEQAVWHQYVYEEWIGCGAPIFQIGFAMSSDGGLHFSKPVVLPGSFGGWDPALTVAPNGTVYAAFMNSTPTHMFPVVEASFNHGKTFPQVRRLTGGKLHDWGDRDFIAVSRTGAIYLTWDYGPSRNQVKIVCPPGGSCAFAA